jgi:hypothetical protein
MESELLQTDQSYPAGSKPTFDEEWTVLAARPVVPLDELPSSQKRRGKLKLVAAFLGAIVLGAVVALLVGGLESTQVLTTNNVDLVLEANQAPAEGSNRSTDSTNPTTVVVSDVPMETATVVSPKTRVTVTAKTKNLPTQTKPEESNDTSEATKSSPIETPSNADATETRDQLFDQWQERRARRVLRRERRDQSGRQRRGLSRIDEIFEGRPRP